MSRASSFEGLSRALRTRYASPIVMKIFTSTVAGMLLALSAMLWMQDLPASLLRLPHFFRPLARAVQQQVHVGGASYAFGWQTVANFLIYGAAVYLLLSLIDPARKGRRTA